MSETIDKRKNRDMHTNYGKRGLIYNAQVEPFRVHCAHVVCIYKIRLTHL
jgi:hypothetical protein